MLTACLPGTRGTGLRSRSQRGSQKRCNIQFNHDPLTIKQSYVIFLTYTQEVFEMDKIMSTRMDEAVIRKIGMLAQKLGTSKKAVLENAVQAYAEKIASEKDLDLLVQTFGSWQRDESADDTITRIKTTMRISQERYKR